MAVAFSPFSFGQHGKNVHAIGDLQLIMGLLQFSGNYAAGGEVITPDFDTLLKQLGYGTSSGYQVFFSPNAGYVFTWNALAQKVLVWQGDNTNAAQAPLVEIPAAAYPAALTNGFTGGARVLAIGV